MDDLNAATLDDVKDVVRNLLRAEQRDPRARGRHRRRDGAREGATLLRRHSTRARPSPIGNASSRAAFRRAASSCRTACPRHASTRCGSRPNGAATNPRTCSSPTTCSTSGKTSRLYQRLVYEDQIATDASAFAMINEIAGAYVVYATAGAGQDLAAVEAALDEELGALPRRRSDAGRARPRQDRDSQLVHPRRRASRRLRRQVEHPRRERRLRRPTRLLQALARGAERRDAAASVATSRQWIRGEPLVIEVQPFPAQLDRRAARAQTARSCRCRRRSRRRRSRRSSKPRSRTACA